MKQHLCLLFVGLNLFALEETLTVPTEEQHEVISGAPEVDSKVLWESFGYWISKHLVSLEIDADIDSISLGITKALKGALPPLSEESTMESLAKLQESAFTRKSIKNLEEAERFLEENSQKEGVTSVENGKLQYTTLEKGFGSKVEPSSHPMVRYKARFLNGETFGSSTEGEVIALSDTFSGLSQGLVGMSEGEKRTLYIHPDLAYSSMGIFPPNALVIFDVEIVKADVPAEENPSLLSEELIDASRLNNLVNQFQTPEEAVR